VLWILDNGLIHTYLLFFCKYIHFIHRNTQTQYRQTCSCTQKFALCGNRTRDLLRCEYSHHYATSAANIPSISNDTIHALVTKTVTKESQKFLQNPYILPKLSHENYLKTRLTLLPKHRAARLSSFLITHW
jgi:hypothetical protein